MPQAQVMEELWVTIPDFPNYQISNRGHVYNRKLGRMLSPSMNNFGQLRVNLRQGSDARQFSRTITRLVAEAFVPKPDRISTTPIVLDGDFYNCVAENLAWRPKAFAWRYTHQLRDPQPMHYRNIAVMNMSTRNEYDCIVTAGINEGLLFDDIWFSVNTGHRIYPNSSIFQITEPDFLI